MLAALLLALAAPTATAAPQPATVIAPTVSPLALQVSQTVQPEALLIAQIERQSPVAFDQMLRGIPDWQEREKESPGLITELVKAFTDVSIRSTRSSMAQTHQRYAGVYQGHFSEGELRELLALYRSPVGQRLLRAKFEAVDIGPIAADLRDDPNAGISQERVVELHENARREAVKGFGSADALEMKKYLSPATIAKMQSFVPIFQAFETEVANEEDPAFDAAMEAAMAAILTRRGIEL